MFLACFGRVLSQNIDWTAQKLVFGWSEYKIQENVNCKEHQQNKSIVYESEMSGEMGNCSSMRFILHWLCPEAR